MFKRDSRSGDSYRELGVAPTTSENFQATLDIRSDHGDVPRELTDCNKEIPEQDEQAVQLDQKSSQRPAEQDEDDTGGEGGSSLEFLWAREERYSLLDTDDKSQSNNKEDLGVVSPIHVE